MYDSRIGRISNNLSLRLSPERKYAPNTYSSSFNYCSPSYHCNPICSTVCYPCCCNCCCCCCCCCYSPKLNFDYNSMSKRDQINEPILNKNVNDNINNNSYVNNNQRRSQNQNEGQNEQNNEEQNEEEQNQNEEEQNQNEQEQNQNEEEQNQNSKNINQSNPQLQKQNTYFSYEQDQFNDFLRKLMDVESRIEDAKINLAQNYDFNCEDAFSLFETNDKDYLDENDLKKGLNSIGVNPTDFEIKLLMKRFDLQKNGNINYPDFFDMIVPFEKNYRTRVERRNPSYYEGNPNVFNSNTMNGLRELFNLLINSENEINEMRKKFGTLRLNLRNIFELIDKYNRGSFEHKDLIEYLENNHIINNIREADLLFIRLDKYRKGRIDYPQIEEEIQTLY